MDVIRLRVLERFSCPLASFSIAVLTPQHFETEEFYAVGAGPAGLFAATALLGAPAPLLLIIKSPEELNSTARNVEERVDDLPPREAKHRPTAAFPPRPPRAS